MRTRPVLILPFLLALNVISFSVQATEAWWLRTVFNSSSVQASSKHYINDIDLMDCGEIEFVFLDRRHGHNGRVIIARDAIGVKSLYSGIVEDEVHIPATDEMTGISVRPCTGPSLVVASEMKALHALSAAGSVSQFPAGHYYDSNTCAMTRWADMNFHPRFPFAVAQYTGDNEDVHSKLRELLTEAVRVRLTMSDRPVGCFLSGGLDSSLEKRLTRARRLLAECMRRKGMIVSAEVSH